MRPLEWKFYTECALAEHFLLYGLEKNVICGLFIVDHKVYLFDIGKRDSFKESSTDLFYLYLFIFEQRF